MANNQGRDQQQPRKVFFKCPAWEVFLDMIKTTATDNGFSDEDQINMVVLTDGLRIFSPNKDDLSFRRSFENQLTLEERQLCQFGNFNKEIHMRFDDVEDHFKALQDGLLTTYQEIRRMYRANAVSTKQQRLTQRDMLTSDFITACGFVSIKELMCGKRPPWELFQFIHWNRNVSLEDIGLRAGCDVNDIANYSESRFSSLISIIEDTHPSGLFFAKYVTYFGGIGPKKMLHTGGHVVARMPIVRRVGDEVDGKLSNAINRVATKIGEILELPQDIRSKVSRGSTILTSCMKIVNEELTHSQIQDRAVQQQRRLRKKLATIVDGVDGNTDISKLEQQEDNVDVDYAESDRPHINVAKQMLSTPRYMNSQGLVNISAINADVDDQGNWNDDLNKFKEERQQLINTFSSNELPLDFVGSLPTTDDDDNEDATSCMSQKF